MKPVNWHGQLNQVSSPFSKMCFFIITICDRKKQWLETKWFLVNKLQYSRYIYIFGVYLHPRESYFIYLSMVLLLICTLKGIVNINTFVPTMQDNPCSIINIHNTTRFDLTPDWSHLLKKVNFVKD